MGNQKRAVRVENMPYHSLISYAFYSSPPPIREKAPFIRSLGEENGIVNVLLGVACFIGKRGKQDGPNCAEHGRYYKCGINFI